MNRKHAKAKTLLTILAIGILASLPVNADTAAERTTQSWVAHADAVFAAADAENLAIAQANDEKWAWVAHADAVFAAADAENLAYAQTMSERMAWVAHADAVFEAADEQNLMIYKAMLANAGS